MSNFTNIATVLLVALGLFGVSPVNAAEDKAKKPVKPAVKKQTRITISKETTRITEPLRPDGYVDYLAALNAHTSRGVTPDNNAAVLLVPMLRLENLSDVRRTKAMRMLGVKPSDKRVEPFVDLYRFTTPSDDEEPMVDYYKVLDKAMARPWRKKDHPTIAAWLTKNAAPLAVVTAAAKRPKYYFPLILQKNSPLFYALLPALSDCREIARALSARAMLHAGRGQWDKARQDLLTCHRLARHVARGPTLVEGLVGIAIDRVALDTAANIAQHGKLTAAGAKAFQAQISNLPRVTDMVAKIDLGERYMYLDSVANISRDGIKGLTEFGIEKEGESLQSIVLKLATTVVIDWNVVCRMGNSAYDRTVKAARLTDATERRKALDRIETEQVQLARRVKDPKPLAKAFLLSKSPRRLVSEQVGGILTILFLPATAPFVEAEHKAVARQRMTVTTFALVAYRAEQGAYPRELAALKGKYLAKIPADPFAKASIRYRREGKGFILYSVGRNGRDDKGQTRDDGDKKDGDKKDDLPIKVTR
jgi:hypothetical protein